MLPEMFDCSQPMLFKGLFKNTLNFGWKECEEEINRSIYNKNIKFIKFNNVTETLYPFQSYWYDEIHDIAQITDFLNRGYSFILERMSNSNKSLNHLCGLIEKKYDSECDVHIYGGLHNESKSFLIHNDRPHNLIIQLEGSCRWKVFKESFPLPPRGVKLDVIEENLTSAIDCVMEPGDGILVPALHAHVCMPLSKRLSASIPFLSRIKHYDPRGWIDLGVSE